MAEDPKASAGSRYAIWYVLAILLILLIFQYYSVAKQVPEITYSEFRHLVETKGVNDLSIGAESIAGKLLPAGIEDLAKVRKEPDLPQKLAQIFEKKEPTFTAARMEDKDLV